MIGYRCNAESDQSQQADARTDKPQPRLVGFRAVYGFERLSRDLPPSLCAPDVNPRVDVFSIAVSTSSMNSSALCNAPWCRSSSPDITLCSAAFSSVSWGYWARNATIGSTWVALHPGASAAANAVT